MTPFLASLHRQVYNVHQCHRLPISFSFSSSSRSSAFLNPLGTLEQLSNITMLVLFFLVLLPYFFGPSTGAVLPRDPSWPPSIIPEQQFISRASPDPTLQVPLITIEDHFISPALEPEVANQPLFFRQRLPDLDDVRLREMDEGQIAKQ